MNKMTTELKNKIAKYKKNRLDISGLIEDVDIKGEDLSGCIIKSFNRMGQDISNCNLSRAVIGEDDKITHLSRANMSNSNFQDTVFKGKVWLRWVDARNCNFDGAFMPFIEYQHADFSGGSFCFTVARMGSRVGFGAKFSKDLIEKWGIILTNKEEVRNGKERGEESSSTAAESGL